MASRYENDLHPQLIARWVLAREKFVEQFPDQPKPVITQTHRSESEQAELYALGRTKPGKIVTIFKPGESLHNYYPALALDIAFRDEKGSLRADYALFKKFAAVAKKFGLEWGGDWELFKEYCHYQPKYYTTDMARNNIEPKFDARN